MNDPVNILILSVGTRNRIVEYFKKELGGRGTVIATDCSPLAPALYAADRGFVVPPVGAEGYLDTLLAICGECGVTCVLSLIDPEQGVLAAHRGDFLRAGALPLVSGAEEVERCLDKYSMSRFLERHGFSVVRRYVDRETFYRDEEAGVVCYPVMVKPRRGSASLNTGRAVCREQVDLCFRLHDDLMIEEFIDGREFGVDAYVDLRSRRPAAIFAKEKIRMRAGETDKSRSVRDAKLFDLVAAFLGKSGLLGVVDLDLLKSGNEYFITDVNPRFGGGYPHAHECGVNFVRLILNNIAGRENVGAVGRYEEDTFMMKYSEATLLKKTDLIGEAP